MNAVDGDIRLTFADGTESFVPMDMGEQEAVDKGEVIYKDDRDALTRRWIWKHSNKDRIESETTCALLTVHVMDGLPSWVCEQVVRDLAESILVNEYGRIIHRDILTSSKRETEFVL